jgi:hypothetical protein
MAHSYRYYKCSPEYLQSISPDIEKEIKQILEKIKKKNNPKNVISDLYSILPSYEWVHCDEKSDSGNLNICRTSANPDLATKADFAKLFNDQIVHLEIQSGKMSEIASDVVKFRIGFAEKRIAAGIEMVSGVDLEQVIDMLVLLDIDCPIWVIGID